MKNNLDEYENDRMRRDPLNYKWGFIYFNPKDKRVIVPKFNKMMGWTLNFANIYSYLLILGLIAAILIAKRLG